MKLFFELVLGFVAAHVLLGSLAYTIAKRVRIGWDDGGEV